MTAVGEISRDDIEAKFRELRGDVDTVAQSARTYVGAAAVAAAVVVVGVSFLIGRRRGRRRTAVVEIRRL